MHTRNPTVASLLIVFLILGLSFNQPLAKADQTEDQLISQLYSSQERQVVRALAILGEKYPRSKEALPIIKKLLWDSRPGVRRKAARVVGFIHAELSQTDLDGICALLESTDFGEIEDGLKALRVLDAPEAVPKILPLLKHTNSNIVRDACRTLAVLGSKENVPAIEPLLSSRDKAIRNDALESIAKLIAKSTAKPPSAQRSPPWRGTSVGTGFLVAENGYILTCEHVIHGTTNIVVRDMSGAVHQATIIAADPANDLCLLRAPTITAAPIPIVPPNSVVVGQTVYCLGYPLEGGDAKNPSPVAGNGVVASLRGLQGDTRHLQITVAINPGNSGGPIFDEYGRWVGVVSHKLGDWYRMAKSGQVAQGFNFAVKGPLAVPLFDSVPSAKMPVTAGTERASLEELVKRLSSSVVLIIATK